MNGNEWKWMNEWMKTKIQVALSKVHQSYKKINIELEKNLTNITNAYFFQILQPLSGMKKIPSCYGNHFAGETFHSK